MTCLSPLRLWHSTTRSSPITSENSAGSTISPVRIGYDERSKLQPPARPTTTPSNSTSEHKTDNWYLSLSVLTFARCGCTRWILGLCQQLFERLERVGFAEGLVPADAVDAREAHRHTRFVAGRAVHAVEGDFEDDLGRHLAHRPVTLHGVVADPAVEALQFLVGEARIGLADGYQLGAAPGAEGI